ncbi:DUF6221 family protein [Streptomyces sp. Ac-502]|uniref:DUF6221 family protein n=1 Tax=Streptomyces sp. Ac-502 TaxID=3342801 RepID=UPI0038625539
MDDLVQFLRDRLDEDERIAKACAGNGQWNADDIEIYGKELAPEVRAHMATHDPARALAEVAAKKRILDFYDAAHSDAVRNAVGIDSQDGTISAATAAVRCLATVYADHPDYNEAWRP